MKTLLIVGAVILSVVLILCILKLYFTFVHKKRGDFAQSVVQKRLKKFAAIRSYKVISDIDLPMSDGRIAHIENLLIGFFGVLIINAKEFGGIIYGDYKKDTWVSVKGKEDKGTAVSTPFKNPIPAMEEAADAVRYTLTSNKIYKTAIESFILFTGSKLNFAVTKGLPLLQEKDFKKLLEKEKYSADGPVDVEEVYNTLMNAAVK